MASMTQIEARGQNGTVTFDGRIVKIERKGFIAGGTVGRGTKSIPLGQISSVQWKPATTLYRGYIEFSIAGGVERRSRVGGDVIRQAMRDENSVVFLSRVTRDFEALHDAVMSAISARY